LTKSSNSGGADLPFASDNQMALRSRLKAFSRNITLRELEYE
jgi:hypothetical protein